MSRPVLCDARGCPNRSDIRGVEFLHWHWVTVSPPSDGHHLTFESAGVTGLMKTPDLIGGYARWSRAVVPNHPTFDACSLDHLVEVLKEMPTGTMVIDWSGSRLRAGVLAGVLAVPEATTEESLVTA